MNFFNFLEDFLVVGQGGRPQDEKAFSNMLGVVFILVFYAVIGFIFWCSWWLEIHHETVPHILDNLLRNSPGYYFLPYFVQALNTYTSDDVRMILMMINYLLLNFVLFMPYFVGGAIRLFFQRQKNGGVYEN